MEAREACLRRSLCLLVIRAHRGRKRLTWDSANLRLRSKDKSVATWTSHRLANTSVDVAQGGRIE